jgi:CheY-like chemotaxis protein
MHCEESLPVRGDATQLREIVTNLLKNALDAISGRGTVMITGAQREGHVRIRVQDTGSGIAPEHMARLFDPFFTTKGDRGTGLGLCLSQQIAERHGGSLSLDSKVGEGTTATLTLPAHDPRHHAALTPTPHQTPSERSDSLSVVVVDDDVNVLRPLCAYLQRAGFQVVSASDGSEGLRAVQERVPDVVPSDIGMPGMDGIELCRRLRQINSTLPIILMSGWASEVDQAAVHSAGARALLAKPFAMQQVTELLTTVARRAESRRPERE